MRCAGSADSHRVRTRTCPSEGRGIGASFQRNSSPVNLPAGRAFKIHWRFLLSVMGVLLSEPNTRRVYGSSIGAGQTQSPSVRYEAGKPRLQGVLNFSVQNWDGRGTSRAAL